VASEDSKTFHRHLPPFRDDDLTAPEDCGRVEHRAFAFYLGAREIDLEAAEEREQIAALTYHSLEASFNTAKDGYRAKRSSALWAWSENARHTEAASSFTYFISLPGEKQTSDDQDQGPKLADTPTDIAELVKDQQSSERNEKATPYLLAGVVRFDETDESDYAEDGRQELPDDPSLNDSQLAEKQHNADTSDHESGNQCSGCCFSITSHFVIPRRGVHSSPPRPLGYKQQNNARGDQQQRPPSYEVSWKIKAYCEDIQAGEQHQGADCGNDDADQSVAGVGGKAIAVHKHLLAMDTVVHEAQFSGGLWDSREVFGERRVFTGE